MAERWLRVPTSWSTPVDSKRERLGGSAARDVEVILAMMPLYQLERLQNASSPCGRSPLLNLDETWTLAAEDHQELRVGLTSYKLARIPPSLPTGYNFSCGNIFVVVPLGLPSTQETSALRPRILALSYSRPMRLREC